MNKPAERVDICDGLQVTLEFGVVPEGIMDKLVLKAQVLKVIEPLVRAKIKSGRECLPDILFVRFRPNSSEEIGREITKVVVHWQVHRPWWSDCPEWSKVPALGGPKPANTAPVIW